MKKGWIAATAVGSVGVIATGTAAIVQANKLKNKTNPEIQESKEIKQ